MKKKRILLIALVVAILLICTKGFAKLRNEDIINNVIVLDNFADIPEDWRLILVNSNNAIPKDYKIELTQLSNGICVDTRIYPDLQNMFDDARKQGIYPVVSEGYRTHQQQQNIMDEKINAFIDEGYSEKDAKKLAEDWVALPHTH